ncbi:MAG: hypothetical protein IH872_01430 [Chloroflexi bacterium]|nr:hypothetical protein [Chloroflexota bacterium]
MADYRNPKNSRRNELILEEGKLAAEIGRVPKQPMSLDENFRVARSTPTQLSQASMLVPSRIEAESNDRDFVVGLPSKKLAKSSDLARAVVPMDARAARAEITAATARLTPEKLDQLLPQIMERLEPLLALGGNPRALISARRALTRRILGTSFRSIRGRNGGGRS